MPLRNDEVRVLSANADLLLHEARLREAGYRFLVAVDFAEIYNYLHPFLEFSASKATEEVAWEKAVRHLIAITYLLNGSDWELVLLEPYRIELENHYQSIKRKIFAEMVEVALLMRDSFATRFFEESRANHNVKRLGELLGVLKTPKDQEGTQAREEINEFMQILGQGAFHRLFSLMKLSQELDYNKVEAAIDELESRLSPISAFGADEDHLPTKEEMLSDPFTRVVIDRFDKVRRQSKYANRIDALAGHLVLEYNRLLSGSECFVLLLTHSSLTRDVLSPFLRRTVRVDGRAYDFPLLRHPSYINAYLIHSAMHGDYVENLERTKKWASAYVNAAKLREGLPEFADTIQPVIEASESVLVQSLVTIENLGAAANENDYLTRCLKNVNTSADNLLDLAVRVGEVLAGEAVRSELISTLEKTSSNLLKSWLEAESPLRERYRAKLEPRGLWVHIKKLLLPVQRVVELPEAVEDLKPYVFVHFDDPSLDILARELLTDSILTWELVRSLVPAGLPKILHALETTNPQEQALFVAYASLLSEPGELDEIRTLVDGALSDTLLETVDPHTKAEFHFLRAISYRLSGDYCEAKQDLEAALVLKPNQARFYKELAVVNWRQSGEDASKQGSRESREDVLLQAMYMTEKAHSCLSDRDDVALRAQVLNNLADVDYLLFIRDHDIAYLRKAFELVQEQSRLVPDDQYYAEFRLVRGSVLLEARRNRFPEAMAPAQQAVAAADLEVAAAFCSRQRDKDDARLRQQQYGVGSGKDLRNRATRGTESDGT